MSKHSCYLDAVLSGRITLEKTLRKTCKEIEELNLDFSHIACRGVSGLVLASPLSLRLKKELLVVRKQTEESHASDMLENAPFTDFNYLIVDDFYSSGKTIANIIKEIKKYGRGNCIGFYGYGTKYREAEFISGKRAYEIYRDFFG